MAFMLPTDDAAPRGPGAATSDAAEASDAARPSTSRHRPLRPIGPDKLRRLRESILNGTYPLDEAVIGGLARMFMGPAAKGRPTDDA